MYFVNCYFLICLILNVNIIDNNFFSETIKTKIYNENYKSLVNGLLMRISPILSWFLYDK